MRDYVLSVVIPTYNTEEYLERCVESLIDERINGKVQIIVVNDGSKDNSLTVANSLAAGRDFVVVVDKPNGGHGSAINKGVEFATGKYFRVLDSDDWYEREDFVVLVSDLEQLSSDVVVTWGFIDRVFENKQLPYVMYEDDSFIEYGKEYKFEDFDFRDKFLVMAHITYRTEILKKNYRPLLENTFYVDNEFLLYPMVNVKTLMFLNYKIYHYFFGRPEQSMNQATIERNITHVERVSLTLCEFYAGLTTHTKAFDNYFKNVTMKIARNYFLYLLFYFPSRRSWAYKQLSEFDERIMSISKEIHNHLNTISYIKLYRKMPRIFSVCSPTIFTIRNFLLKRS